MTQVSTYQLFTSCSFFAHFGARFESRMADGGLFLCMIQCFVLSCIIEDYPFFELDFLHLNVDERNNNVIVNKSNLVILNISTNQ